MTSSTDRWDWRYPASSMYFNGITNEDDLTDTLTRASALPIRNVAVERDSTAERHAE